MSAWLDQAVVKMSLILLIGVGVVAAVIVVAGVLLFMGRADRD
jgi:hypothetical protein